MKWRTIFTDTEGMTGVAPECGHQNDVSKHSSGDGFGKVVDPHGVYDCCPHPHIECWDESFASLIARYLTCGNAEPCS